MPHLDGFDHQTGLHCRSAAPRNLAEYHHWGIDEAACFGLGAGLGFELLELPGQEWAAFRPCSRSFEVAFFERMRVPHQVTEETNWDEAWKTLHGALKGNSPVILILDPAELEYLSRAHLPPHVALAVGVDETTVYLSDGTLSDVQQAHDETLRAAWETTRPGSPHSAVSL